MGVEPIHKREFHALISHAHKAAVEQLYAWLSDQTGIPIWYEAHRLAVSRSR